MSVGFLHLDVSEDLTAVTGAMLVSCHMLSLYPSLNSSARLTINATVLLPHLFASDASGEQCSTAVHLTLKRMT